MSTVVIGDKQIAVEYVPLASLTQAPYNPRKWDDAAKKGLKESIQRFGLVDPIIVNRAKGRENIIIGGNFRAAMAVELGIETAPVVFVEIEDLEREKELCLRLNRNTGEFDLNLLADFDEAFLKDIGFDSEELDDIFPTEEIEDEFDIQKELEKLEISEITIQKGDVYEFPDGSRLMCGDSTVEADMQKLMGGEKADLCFTDPPYILDYLHGKGRHGDATTGFGAKRNRRYLETESLPDNFTELWMANIAQAQKKNFSIIVYENWKNIRTIWGEMEKHWKVRNMLVWHLPNRNQGYAGKSKFFSKHDIAMVGTSEEYEGLNEEPETELLQNEYETALFAISGDAHWESYGKGKKFCPTDHIDFKAADEKSSGQAIIFGTKPLEILIPYIKVLTKRGDLIIEPFGGSGSTGAAAMKMGRKCYTMEKVPTYAEVIKRRWELQTGTTARKIA